MGKRFLLGCVWMLMSVDLSFGQGPIVSPSPTVDSSAGTWCAGVESIALDACKPEVGPAIWVNGEYLLWWLKQPSQPVPLITTGNPASPVPGGIGFPGTEIIVGAGANTNSFGYGAASGIRLTAGAWFDSDQCYGLELSGFILEQKASGISLISPTGNNPVLSIPFNDVFAGETAILSAGNPNGIQSLSTTRLWGADATGVINLARNNRSHLDFLTGFRYLNLKEGFSLGDSFTDTVTGGKQVMEDSFRTGNQFYGKILGLRGGINLGRVNIDATARASLGSNQENLEIYGYNRITNGAFGIPSGTYPGGIFAQSTNSGSFKRDRFAVVPEARLQLGYRLCDGIKATVGYDFLYISNVIRPMDQIDRTLNFSGNPLYGSGSLNGPARPVVPWNSTDFHAQGLAFGLTLEY